MDVPDALEVSMTDIVILGRCRNMRTWFREQGLYDEFRVLVKGGTIAAAKLLETGDPRAPKVIAHRLARESADG